jgi:hypothetical protein
VSFNEDIVALYNVSAQLLLQLFQASQGIWSEGLDGCIEISHV